MCVTPSTDPFHLCDPQLGMGKSVFVNDNTSAVHRSVQVIEWEWLMGNAERLRNACVCLSAASAPVPCLHVLSFCPSLPLSAPLLRRAHTCADRGHTLAVWEEDDSVLNYHVCCTYHRAFTAWTLLWSCLYLTGCLCIYVGEWFVSLLVTCVCYKQCSYYSSTTQRNWKPLVINAATYIKSVELFATLLYQLSNVIGIVLVMEWIGTDPSLRTSDIQRFRFMNLFP